MTQFAWLWIATLILKLLLSGILPLAPDEAYYWVWSHHFQLSYYDHPPFVAWLFAIAQPMESIFSIVRWPAVLLGHLAFWFWLPLFRNILSGRQLLVWAALWLTSPLTGPGSMVVTPDLPLLFFWPLALWALLRTLETRSIAWASLLGLALGLGFCSKYHMGLFGILAIAWLTWERKFSRDLVVPILACVVFFFIFSSPVWIWNAQNDFVSFKFQMNHGLGGESWKPFWTWSYVLGQILLLFPLVSWAAANGLRKEPLPLWLKVFAIGPLLFFFATSFKGKVEANWPIVAYPFVFAIASRQLARWQVWSTSAVWMGIFVILAADLSLGVLPETNNPLKTKEIREFSRLGEITRDSRPLYAHSYQMASKMSFDLKEPIYKLQGNGRRDFFDTLDASRPRDSLFYFLTYERHGLPHGYDGYQIVTRQSLGSGYELLEVRMEQ